MLNEVMTVYLTHTLKTLPFRIKTTAIIKKILAQTIYGSINTIFLSLELKKPSASKYAMAGVHNKGVTAKIR